MQPSWAKSAEVMDPEIQFPWLATAIKKKQLQKSLVREHCNLDQIKSNFPLCEEWHCLERGHQKRQNKTESLKPDTSSVH